MSGTKGRSGRPRQVERDENDKGRIVATRIDYSDVAAIKRIAKRRGCTQAEVIRNFITWGIENDKR
jgi:hypothetical protein